MKALEKDRRRRYETANDFAADVMRYLTDQPVRGLPAVGVVSLPQVRQPEPEGPGDDGRAGGLGPDHRPRPGRGPPSKRQPGPADHPGRAAGARGGQDGHRGPRSDAGRPAGGRGQGRLGADGASLPDLAAEIGGIRREIDARQADAARFDQFLKGASDAQDKMSFGDGPGRRERVAEESLGLYGVLTEKDWLSRLESSYLTADQKQQVRETAYVTLVSLADFCVRWRYREPKSVARSLDLLQRARGLPSADAGLLFRACRVPATPRGHRRGRRG